MVATHAMNYAKSYPQCTIVEGMGGGQKLLFHPIITECTFQIVRVDIMELPITAQGN